jgi:phosphoserine phosphatase
MKFLCCCLASLLLCSASCSKKEKEPPAPPAAGSAQAPAPPTSVTAALPADALPGAWEADVRTNLAKLIGEVGKGGARYSADKPPVAVFDFDNTMVQGDIGRSFFDWMILQRKIKFNDAIFTALPDDRRAEIRDAVNALNKLPEAKQAESVELQKLRKLMHRSYWGLCHSESWEKCFPWQVRFYAGYTPRELAEMAVGVFEKEQKRPVASEPIKAGPDDPEPGITGVGLRVHEEMRSLIRLLRERGFQVWVVTAGPQYVVEGAARSFGVDADHVLGMRTTLEGGKITTTMDPPPTFRTGKVKAIERFIGARPVLAFGDSWTDAEMLAAAEHAVLIDRGYADLKKKAQESGWWIQPAFPVK